MVHPIVDPTKFWDDVGEWRRPYTAMETELRHGPRWGSLYSAPQIFCLDLAAGVRKGIKDGRTGERERGITKLKGRGRCRK